MTSTIEPVEDRQTDASGRHDRRRLRVPPALGFGRISVIYVLVLAVVIFTIWVPDTFARYVTFTGVLNDNAVTALVALALVVPLAAGVFDLSVGYIMGASTVMTAWLLGNTDHGLVTLCVLVLLFSAALGAVNGIVVVVMRIDSFIGTLATGSLLQAVILIISDNQTMTEGFNDNFLKLGQASKFQLVVPVYVALGVTLILWYALGHTPLGRKIYATGLAETPARLAGIRTSWIQFGSLIVSAVIAGIAGILVTAVVAAGSPTVGPSYLIPAFAAAFLGATQFRDKLFNAWGTLLAVWLLGTITSGLSLTGAPLWMPQVFQGVVLIAALALGGLQGRQILKRFRGRARSGANHAA